MITADKGYRQRYFTQGEVEGPKHRRFCSQGFGCFLSSQCGCVCQSGALWIFTLEFCGDFILQTRFSAPFTSLKKIGIGLKIPSVWSQLGLCSDQLSLMSHLGAPRGVCHLIKQKTLLSCRKLQEFQEPCVRNRQSKN